MVSLAALKVYTSDFVRQFRALAFKNFRIKCRSWTILLAELLLPIIIIVALGAIKNGLNPTNYDEIVPANHVLGGQVSTIYELYDQATCGSQNLVWRCTDGTLSRSSAKNCPSPNPSTNFIVKFGFQAATFSKCTQQYIAVAPLIETDVSSTSAASEFVSWANTRNQYSQNGVTLKPSFQLFSSEQKILEALNKTSYSFEGDIFSSAVIFREGFPNFDYTVRLNKTYITPSATGRRFEVTTRTGALSSSVKSSLVNPPSSFGNISPYYLSWVEDGYVPLTNEVNTFIATKACMASTTSTTCNNMNSDVFEYSMKQSNPFPSPSYSTTGFWGALGTIFSLLMIVTLLYPLANVISVLVREKEAKLREGMKMMALMPEVLWASWWFNFIALFIPLSVLLTFVGRKLFDFSSPALVFLYFFIFFISATAYAIFIAAFFTNSRTAAIVGSLIFFGGFFIYVGVSGSTDRSTILLACLHPATAFTFSSLAFVEYEDSQMGVTNFTWNVSELYAVTFRDCLNMMFIDALYLSLLTWYFDKVWPSEFGTHEPFYFVFNPHYWMKVFGISKRASYSPISTETSPEAVNVEVVSENLMAQFGDKTCIDIKNLYKEFPTPQGPKVAVAGLNLAMFQGQITALLGHNGAGKTTTMSMLTGLISPDAGTAMIEGMDIREDMYEIRKNMGVCPQHDILFPDLTVREHLTMFAMFKGVTSDKLESAVEAMILSVGLTEKRDIPSRSLSGGQKRKLSVGIAFIGGSRIVFLDEPTSGMDPYSRRFTWNVIKQHREGRVIVLTTHFMDEADLLGDRIAIMGDGKLCCCGSSLYLKTKYGAGYSMIIEKRNASTFDSQAMESLVRTHINDSSVLNDVGTEMSFQLPFAESKKFPKLFEHLEVNQENLGVASYGVAVTTLEEVFIKITRNTHTNKTAADGLLPAKTDVQGDSLVVSKGDIENAEIAKFQGGEFSKIDEKENVQFFIRHVSALLRKRLFYFVRDRKAQIFLFLIPFFFLLGGLIIMANTFPSTFEPWKRISKDLYNAEVKTNVLPTPVVNPSDYKFSMTNILNGVVLGTSPGAQYSRSANALSTAQDVLNAVNGKSNFPLIDVINGDGSPYTTTPYNVSRFLVDNKNDNQAMIVGSIAMTNVVTKAVRFTLSTNYTAVYAVPLYQSIMADATVKSMLPQASVSTAFQPFPETKRQNDLFTNYNVDLVVTFILLAIPFVPASFITFIVREKEVRSKQQQMVSGVGVVAYWISTFIWDNISFGVTTCMFAFLVAGPFYGDRTTQLGGGGEDYRTELGLFFGLCFLFGLSVSGFAYICSYLFQAPSNAQICMIFFCFITGLVLSIVGIVLRILADTRDLYNNYLRYLFCVFPPCALGDGLHSMALINVWSGLEQGGVMYSAKDWKITGIPIMMMAIESVLYLGLTIGIEYLTSVPKFQQYLDSVRGTVPPTDESLKDDDVIEEEKRCSAGEFDQSATILVKNLKKLYNSGCNKPGKFAVKGVSLAIPNGQCFGLLGVNGAGKTSTLSMLSGEFAPTSGEASIAGLNLLTQIHTCRRKVGYCPQFDSIFELLTAREHLQLYARIKGIKEEFIEAVVNTKIAEMGLTEYADRYAGTFSGGNKRKLMVAIAMIGNPSIVFLDEPSTGMDPVARRFMWNIIADIVTVREKCSVILTTHSMEECEALCTRIGIMVGGVLRCLGSAQRIRSKYGRGYQIEFGMILPTAAAIDTLSQKILSFAQANASQIVSGDKPTSEQTVINIVDRTLNKDQLMQVFRSELGKSDWIARLTPTGSGADLLATVQGDSVVDVKQVSSWMILEEQYDKVTQFLSQYFGSYHVRERQTTKIRVEIGEVNVDNSKRMLSKVFAAVEAHRSDLNIQDYSVSQTSLEQIFNFFAAQQEEETGHASGLALDTHASAVNTESVGDSKSIELTRTT